MRLNLSGFVGMAVTSLIISSCNPSGSSSTTPAASTPSSIAPLSPESNAMPGVNKMTNPVNLKDLQNKKFALLSDMNFSDAESEDSTKFAGTDLSKPVVRFSYYYHLQQLITSDQIKPGFDYCEVYVESNQGTRGADIELPAQGKLIVITTADFSSMSSDNAPSNDYGFAITFQLGDFADNNLKDLTLECHNVPDSASTLKEIGNTFSLADLPAK